MFLIQYSLRCGQFSLKIVILPIEQPFPSNAAMRIPPLKGSSGKYLSNLGLPVGALLLSQVLGFKAAWNRFRLEFMTKGRAKLMKLKKKRFQEATICLSEINNSLEWSNVRGADGLTGKERQN